MKFTALAAVAVLALAGCGSSTPTPTVSATVASAPVKAAVTKPAKPKPVTPAKPAVDPVVKAITDGWGDCLVKLKFTKPFKMDVYPDKAVVYGTPGSIVFSVAKSNTGSLLTVPVDSGNGNTTRAMASVGCG